MALVFRTIKGSVGGGDPAPCACGKCQAAAADVPTPRQAARSTETVPSPTIDAFVASFRKGATSVAENIRKAFGGGGAIGPAPKPNISPGAHFGTAAPPDLNARIVKQRKGK